MPVRCEDTYQAAWFLMNGAHFVSFEKRYIKAGKGKKYGIHTQWIINMIDVPDYAIEKWIEGAAQGNIRHFSDARKKLKRLIKKYEDRYC